MVEASAMRSHFKYITLILLLYLTSVLSLKGSTLTSATLVQIQESSERPTDVYQLFEEGNEQYLNNQYREALNSFQQVLSIRRKLGDRAGVAEALHKIGATYDRLGEYLQALDFYQQALVIRREIGDKIGQGSTLNGIAIVYQELSDYSKALEFLNQALTIRREVGDRAGEGRTLSNIGLVYSNQGKYPQALDFYQQALAIFKQLGNFTGEGALLDNIGGIHAALGQYSQAIEFYQKALAIRKEIGDRTGVGTTLHNIGYIYDQQHQYSKALEFYQQALAVRQEVGDRPGEATTLNNIGLAYSELDRSSQALQFLEKSLLIFRELGDRASEGNTLDSIGTVYKNLAQYSPAMKAYQQALAILREVGTRSIEKTTLSNIGSLLEKQNQPALAIVFYKQFVNITEEIRKDLRVLPREQQESYTQTVANTYRSLANLLLSQGRILEAQQVLELLKIQELRDFTQNSRAGGETAELALNKIEEQIIQTHGSLIAFGQQLDACQKSRCSELSQLLDRRDALTQQYNQTVQRLAKEIRDRRSQDEAFFDPSKLSKAREIVEAQPGSVLIYPLVLENKIWLIWAAQGGIVKSIEVDKVGQRQLGETILKFRQLLQTPSSNLVQLKATGKQLYDWLIQPLEPELKANKIQNLVFSLDRVTRYIPTSALFDGKNYLIENYSISTILSADLTDVRDRLPPGTQNTSVLALGLSEAIAGFDALPNVPAELNVVVRRQPMDEQGVYPGLEFLNQEFDYRALRDNLLGKKILHIATHGEFVPGRPEDSYLLLGTGEKLTIPRIETLQDLNDVHLVVLSACETALGGADSDGVEIAGISYYFLNRGAKAVMASLWKVNDSSTSQLMQAFYSSLANSTAQDPVTKAAALQQAQLSLLYGNTLPRNVDNRSIGEISKPDSPPAATARTGKKFAHPYYWAPFILIGNGL